MWGKNMSNAIWRKGAAIGATLIIISLVFMTALSSRRGEAGGVEETLTAEITEYQADGSVVRRVVTLTLSAAEELKEALLESQSQEQRFRLLKDYGLLPEEAGLGILQEGMAQRAEAIGLGEDEAYRITVESAKLGVFRLPFLLNFFCKVNGVYVLSGNARLGLPPLLGFLKFFGGASILSADLVDVCWGALGILETKGLLRQHSLVMVPSFLFMAGFVGVHIHIPPVLNVYNGFSAATFATGLGPHQIKFSLASSMLTTFILGTMLGILFGQAGQTTE